LRAHLAAAVPPSDQILLLGPPYKVPKDSTLHSEEVLNALRLGDIEDDSIPEEPGQDNVNETNEATTVSSSRILSATERTGARRLFLFSKRSLSGSSSVETPICSLQPKELKLPTEPAGPSPLANDLASTTATLPPLHQALTAYEKQFSLYLAQGQVLADGADLRLQACRTSVQEQAVIARALRAAVSNLSDHYHTATRTRAEFTASFQTKLALHSNLLHQFEQNLVHLANVRLDPSLVSMARSSGRVLETLLDTVPVEKERAWAQQCQLGHERLATLFNELDSAFQELGTAATREEEAAKDKEAEDEIQSLWNAVEGQAKQYRDGQANRLNQLTLDHGDVLKIIMEALRDDGESGEDKTQAAFGPLGEKSKSSKDLVPAMMEDDAKIKAIMERVEQGKTKSMQRMKIRLKEISRAQSNIQRVLTNVGVVRDAMTQQMENMAHLEHLAELPGSYGSFLSEIRRRRAYGHAVNSLSRAMVERLATMRTDEVKAREKFLRGPGRHLMPVFFDLFAPTLATPPPLFTPQMPAMVEMDTMPRVEDETATVGAGTVEMQDAGAVADTEMQAAADPGGTSSASSLTAESHAHQHQQQNQAARPGAGTDPMIASTVHGSDTQPSQQEGQPQQREQNEQQQDASKSQQPAQNQDHLIVSADDHSGNDIIVDPAEGAAVDAEVKTLAYENAVLRQTIERMGGKAPRAYLEEAAAQLDKSKETAAGRSNSARDKDDRANTALELAALRKELAEAKAKTTAAEESLKKVQGDYNVLAAGDKISHRSFEVGDVGLFMLASRRNDGGKRTYLAFHTNCPHRYLSLDCVNGEPNFVVGRIVLQEELLAGDLGTDANPYGLPIGTKFWVVTVEVITSY